MLEQLLEVNQKLSSLGVPHCLIGGLAVSAHGVPRYTADVDFLVHPRLLSLEEDLREFARQYGASFRHSEPAADDPLGPILIMVLGGATIDLIVARHPHEFSCISRARSLMLAGTAIPCAAPEDLILLKLYAGGPQDLYDVQGIIEVQESLDLDYVRQQVTAMRLEDKWAVVCDLIQQQSINGRM